MILKLQPIGMTAEKLSHLKPPPPPMPKSELLKYKSTVETKSLELSEHSAFSMATIVEPKPQTIFEVLQDICEKNDLRFGQAIASIFGSDVDLFYKTNEELLQIINEKKIQLNLK
jgi:hypothetical protein